MKECKHWLDRPRNVTRLVHGLYSLCGALLLADLFYEKQAHFAFERWFGFYAGFGFIACVSLVLLAKLLRRLVKRGEDYYDREAGHG